MSDFAHEASVKNYTVKIQTPRKLVEEWVFTYCPELKEKAEFLINELERVS